MLADGCLDRMRTSACKSRVLGCRGLPGRGEGRGSSFWGGGGRKNGGGAGIGVWGLGAEGLA